MANVQLEHGFIRIANALDLALIRSPLSIVQQAVARALIRLTYGYNRTEAQFTSRQLEEITHRAARHCRRALLDLERIGIAVRVAEPRRGRAGTWAVGKDYDRWDFTSIRTRARPSSAGKPGRKVPLQRGTFSGEGAPPQGHRGAPPQGHLPSLRGKTTLKDTHTPRPRSHIRGPRPEARGTCVCVNLFESAYRSALGIDPVVTAAGRRALAALERTVGAERIEAALPAYFRMRDDWLREAAYPAAAFESRFSACELAVRRAARRRELRAEREPEPSADERRAAAARLGEILDRDRRRNPQP